MTTDAAISDSQLETGRNAPEPKPCTHKAAPRPAKRARLTRAQSAKVRELMEDGGYSRAEAVAWVTTFEVAP